MVKATAKRHVRDQEYEAALKNQDNVKVLHGVAANYRNVLSEDELRGCALKALWRALQGHRSVFGQKFTTSLHRFMRWECNREAGGRRRVVSRCPAKSRPQQVRLNIELLAEPDCRQLTAEDVEEMDHVQTRMALLPEEHREILKQHYLDGMGINDICAARSLSREAVRRRLRRAMDALRRVCED